MRGFLTGLVLLVLFQAVPAWSADCKFATMSVLLSSINNDCSGMLRLTDRGKMALELAESYASTPECVNEAIQTVGRMRSQFGASFCSELAQSLQRDLAEKHRR